MCGHVPSLSRHIEGISAGHFWMQHSAKGPLAREVGADRDLCPDLPQKPYSPPGDLQLASVLQAETMIKKRYKTTEIFPSH